MMTGSISKYDPARITIGTTFFVALTTILMKSWHDTTYSIMTQQWIVRWWHIMNSSLTWFIAKNSVAADILRTQISPCTWDSHHQLVKHLGDWKTSLVLSLLSWTDTLQGWKIAISNAFKGAWEASSEVSTVLTCQLTNSISSVFVSCL